MLWRSLLIPLFVLGCGKRQSHTALEIEFRDWHIFSTPNGGISAAYGKMRNRSNRERILQKVEVSCAARAELHETKTNGDRVSMEHLDSVVIPPGGLVHFQPGGKHIMIHDARFGENKACDLRLAFAEGRVIQFRVPIKARGE